MQCYMFALLFYFPNHPLLFLPVSHILIRITMTALVLHSYVRGFAEQTGQQ